RKVTEWTEFGLPGFEGWFTHSTPARAGFSRSASTADFRSVTVGTVRASRWCRRSPRVDDVLVRADRSKRVPGRFNVAIAVGLSDTRKKSVELTIAIVPAGTSFPAVWQKLCNVLARQQSPASTS